MKPTRLLVSLSLPRLLAALPLLPAASLLASGRPAQAQPLPERRVISGRVTGSDGNGVPKATVTIQRENDIGSFAFWGSQTATDASGNFSFPEAEDGSYFISIEAEGYAPSQNRPLRVDDNSAVYNTRLERLVNVPLRLLKADGTPLSKASVVLRLMRPDAGGPQPLRRQTNAQGIIQIDGQSPATYSLDVMAPGEGYASLRDIVVRFSDKPQPIDVRLQSGGGLKITARDANEATKYLGGATLSLSAILEPGADARRAGRLSTRSISNLQTLYAFSSDGSGAVTREGDGTLELSDLPPGRYRAKLVLPSYAPSETREVEVKAGQQSSADFELSPQVRSSSLKILMLGKNNQPLANRDWTLQLRSLGALRPGQAAMLGIPEAPENPENAAVEIGTFGISPRRGRTNDKGELTVFPLRAGRWRVVAFLAGEDGKRSAIASRDVNVDDDGAELTLNFRSLAP